MSYKGKNYTKAEKKYGEDGDVEDEQQYKRRKRIETFSKRLSERIKTL